MQPGDRALQRGFEIDGVEYAGLSKLGKIKGMMGQLDPASVGEVNNIVDGQKAWEPIPFAYNDRADTGIKDILWDIYLNNKYFDGTYIEKDADLSETGRWLLPNCRIKELENVDYDASSPSVGQIVGVLVFDTPIKQ